MYKKGIALIVLLTLVLASCGTADTPKTPDSKEQGDATQPDNNGTQSPNENETDKNDENEAKDKVKSESETEITIDYKINGVDKSGQAIAQHNDNQNYTMHVLPEYTLTAEEPNNDIIYATDQPGVFMRIQLLDNDVDWDALTENATEQLKAINENITSVSPPDGPFFENAVIMETSIDNEFVTTYLIKNHSVPLKLLLFTEKDADHTDAFLQMAKTIVKD